MDFRLKTYFGKGLGSVGKTIDFDLNILTYLNRVMIGRKVNINEVEFLNYLIFLKREGFQIGIATALMERMRTPVDLGILSEMRIVFSIALLIFIIITSLL